jgi:hypothetical protein
MTVLDLAMNFASLPKVEAGGMFQSLVITVVAIAVPGVTAAIAVGCLAILLRVMATRQEH